MLAGNRRIVAAGRRHEAIIEAVKHHARRRLVQIQVERMALAQKKPRRSSMPWVWSACSWVISTPSSQSALAPISCSRKSGAGVDQDARDASVAALLDQNGTTPAAVLRIVRIAGTPAERRARHAARTAAAQNGDAQAHTGLKSKFGLQVACEVGRGTFENNLKKFSVVWFEICSSETPRTSASVRAVSTT